MHQQKKKLIPYFTASLPFGEEVGHWSACVYLPAKVWQYRLRSTIFRRLSTSGGSFSRVNKNKENKLESETRIAN